MNDEEKLTEILARGETAQHRPPDNCRPKEVEAPSHPSRVPLVSFSQWSVEPNDIFRPSGPRQQSLATGVYRIDSDNRGICFQRMRVITDSLIELEDSASLRVISSMKVFWESKQEYTKRSILYKRGILLWGPAGSGKTATIGLLTKELLGSEGIVIVCSHPGLVSEGLSILRRIEADRNLIVVLEDIDEIMEQHGEHSLLALLDGENQVDNVVMLATTNYPERLGARIINRPSRFDERILVDMPSPRARERYLRHVTASEEIDEARIARWVADTEGLSVAHLRELVVAVFCLKQPYEEVMVRLKAMQFQLKALPEFKRGPGGFADQIAKQAQCQPGTQGMGRG